MEPEAAGKVIGEKKAKPRQWQRATIGLVVAVIVVVAVLVIWKLYTPPAPQPEVVSKEKIVDSPALKSPQQLLRQPPPSAAPSPKEKVAPPSLEKVAKPTASTCSQSGSLPPKRRWPFPLPDKPSIAVLPFAQHER